MRISISGAHSTGKSTVIDALKQEPRITSRFEFKGEILRSIKRAGISINEAGTDNTQLLVLSRMLENSTLDNVILDRCALDSLVYTAYLFEKEQVSKNTMRLAESIFENTYNDIYFYIKPEFDIVPDGVRSECTEFRDRISELFEEYIDVYYKPVILLTGSVEERVAIFKEALKMYDEWMSENKREK